MSFERGKDPKETMEIGRQKDAIPVLGVKYYTNGQGVSITDPEIIRIFLEQFSTYQLPYNPIFGPQRILIISTEKYLDDSPSLYARMASLSGLSVPTHNTDPIEREKQIDINILDFEGKTAIFEGRMYEMPSLFQLEERGFGYFEKCEKNYVREMEKILITKKAEMYEQMKAMKAMANSQYGANMDLANIKLPPSIFENDENDIKKKIESLIPKKAKKKKKKIWLWDIETAGL